MLCLERTQQAGLKSSVFFFLSEVREEIINQKCNKLRKIIFQKREKIRCWLLSDKINISLKIQFR